jgi:uncharacterized membrane protein
MTQHDPLRTPAFRIATFAILITVTEIFTYMVRIPIAPTRGYVNFGDVAIYFTAILFGPFTAFITGGLGTAIADLLSGYAHWAPFTFLAHGLQGLFIGLIIKADSSLRLKRLETPVQGQEGVQSPEAAQQKQAGQKNGKTAQRRPALLTLVIAFLAGTLTMGGIYFLTGGMMVGFAAAATEIPGNILQNLVGVLVGTPLALAVWKAYPPIRQSAW